MWITTQEETNPISYLVLMTELVKSGTTRYVGVATVCTIQSLLFPVPLLDHWFASLVTSSHVPCVLPAQGYFMREGGYFIVLFESNI